MLIASQLDCPVLVVGPSGDAAMFRAKVPEAPIDEYGDAPTREHNVGAWLSA